MSQNKTEIKYISFLKGIAMISIFLAHAPQGLPWIDNKWTAWGANGVKLLFVIAGFLTAKSYIGRTCSIKKFEAKRFFRLAPLYWCAILFWHIIYVIDKSRVVTYFMTEHDFAAVFLNILLLNGIFVHGNNTVVPGGWYVGAIFLFYVLVPIIIKGISRLWEKCPLVAVGMPALCFCCLYLINYALFRISFLSQISSILVIQYSVFFQLPSLLLGVNLWFEFTDDKGGWKISNIWLVIGIIFFVCTGLYSTYVNYNFNQITWGYLSYFFIIFVSRHYSLLEKSKISIIISKLGVISYEFFLVHLFFTIAVLPIVAKILLKYVNECMAYIMSLTLTFIFSYIGALCIHYNISIKWKRLHL